MVVSSCTLDFKDMLPDVKNNSTKICFCGYKRFNQSWNNSPFNKSLTRRIIGTPTEMICLIPQNVVDWD